MCAENMKDTLKRVGARVGEEVDEVVETALNMVKSVEPIGTALPRYAAKPVVVVKSMMEKKLEKSVAEVEEALPILERAGFRLAVLDIEIGTMPKLVPRFEVVRDLTAEESRAIVQEAGKDRMTRVLLELLLKTKSMLSFSIGSLKFHQIEVHLGAIPKASVRYVR